MLTLLYGRDWTANRDHILMQIARDVREKKTGRILLVPELISHDTERRLASVAGVTASRYAEVLSFTRLGRRVCDLVGNAAEECLDNGGRVVAMASAAQQLMGKLKHFAAVLSRPEFLVMLVETVDECKQCGIDSQMLMAASRDPRASGEFVQKIEELALLMGTYEAICQQGKRDPRDQMTWVLEQLEDIDFAEEHVLYVDGFPDFTKQHLDILEHFIRKCPQVVVSLNCDGHHSTDPAFEKAAATAKTLKKLAQRAGVPVHTQMVAEPESLLTPVRHSLFRGDIPLVPDGLSVYHCDSIYQECQMVAEQILSLRQSGCRYRDISLVCGDMSAYRNVLQMVFGKYQIPLYLSGTEDILQHGVIATVLYALDAALGDLEQKDVLRYLRSAMSPLSADQCDLVENYVVIWGISGKRCTMEWTQHPDGLRGIWDDQSRAHLAQLEAARTAAILPLIRLKEGFRNASNLKQQVQALYAFLEEVSFAQRLGQYADQLQQQNDHRSAQILNQLWEILLTGLEQLHDVLGDSLWKDENFSRLLKLLLSQYDVGTIPCVLDAVTAGSVSAMRCQQTEHLFVLGAGEGSMPAYNGTTGVLNTRERLTLRDMQIYIADGALDGLQTEYAEIYGVFCGAKKSVTVSYTGTQPSFIYRRLAGMTGAEEQTYTPIGHALVDPAAAGAYFAKHRNVQSARDLGVEQAYWDVLHRSGYQIGRMNKETVQNLYGQRLVLSASQVDSFAQCRLSYFLKYGLRAQERKEATVDPAEFGTYVHAVLEETARDVMAAGGFHKVSLEETMAIAMSHSKAYAETVFDQLASQRMEYLFRRNVQELEMVVAELWRELSASQYAPHKFELQFSYGGEMPAIEIPSREMTAELRGFVDRVDQWKRGDSTYFRVVDYKTGKKDFDYCDVFNGVGLQMLLYLFALEDAGESVLEGKRVSAGVQYFPARAPYFSTDGTLTPEEAEAERLKLWKRKGLLLSDTDSLSAMDPSEKMDILCCTRKKDGSLSGDLADRSQMGQLKDYVMKLLSQMVDQIASGQVGANPYTRGTSHSACTFCPYGAICHKAHVPERRDYKTMTSQRFWEEIEKEVGKHGG